MKNKFLEIVEEETGKKSKSFIIYLKEKEIGKINFYPPWRKYTLRTSGAVALDADALVDIIEKLNSLNTKPKKVATEEKSFVTTDTKKETKDDTWTYATPWWLGK